MKGYAFLAVSIVFEVFGTAFLKLSEGFTNFLPTITFIVLYVISFSCFVYALKTIALSVGYSIWAGIGTAGAALVGVFLFKETMSAINIFGLVVIIFGVVLMNMGKTGEERKKVQVTS